MNSSDIRSSSAPVLTVLTGLSQMVLWAWSGSQLPLGMHEGYSNACGHLVGGGQEEKRKKQANKHKNLSRILLILDYTKNQGKC